MSIALSVLQTLIMGNRDNLDEMSTTNAAVLLSILKLIDKYNLYGQVAYPKHHKQSDVPDIYRLAAQTKVFYLGFGSRGCGNDAEKNMSLKWDGFPMSESSILFSFSTVASRTLHASQ